MPASPEVRDALAAVGRVEVDREVEAQHEAEPDRHVAVAREVEVDLEGVGRNAEPGVGGAEIAGIGQRERAIGGGGQRIGEQQLLHHADLEEQDAAVHLRPAVHAVLQFVFDNRIAHNGARDELREHRHITQEVDEARGGLHLAAIHVDCVTHRLERVERDADGQYDVHPREVARKPEAVQQRAERLHPKVRILEPAEQGEVGDDGQHEPSPAVADARLAVPFDALGEPVIHGAARKQQHDERRLPPAVEHEAARGDQQRLPGPWTQQVQQQERWQERVKEDAAGEDHRAGRRVARDLVRAGDSAGRGNASRVVPI